MSLIEGLLNIFAPHECLGCKKEGSLLCGECSSGLKKVPERCYACGRWSQGFCTCERCRKKSPLHVVMAATQYNGAAKELLYVFKFARAKAGSEVIAGLIADTAALPEDIIITHIPTAQVRVRERGYDQAALIAKRLAVQTRRPYTPLLARLGDQRQIGQSREIRKKQMENAFRTLKVEALRNKHVLLVDDVLTTGATCEVAARTLRRAGAKRVSAALFAVA